MILIKENVERVADNQADVERLKQKGFKPLKKESTQAEKQKNLHQMKVEELRTLATERGIEGAAVLPKKDLLELLGDESDV